MSQDKAIDLNHYFRMAWRQKGIILLCLITTFCTSLIGMAFRPNEYESRVVLLVEDAGLVSRDVLEITGGLMQTPTGRDVDKERLAKLAGKINSRPFLERVVRMLRMHEDPVVGSLARERQKSFPSISVDEMAIRMLVEGIQSRLGFRGRGPGVYELTVADRSPENARLLAWWISELFVDVSDQKSLESIREAEMFGQERLRRFDESLRQAEQAYEAVRRERIEQALLPSSVTSHNLHTAETLRQRTADEATRARIRVRSHEEAISGHGLMPNMMALLQHASIRELADRLMASLKSEATDRLASGSGTAEIREWPPEGAYWILRREVLQGVERLVADQYPSATPDARGSIAAVLLSRIDADAHESTAALLDRSISRFRNQVGMHVESELELARLESDVARSRRLREKSEDYIVATDVRRAIEMANLGLRTEILDPARLPLNPSRPNRPKIIMASLALGALLGAGMAFLVETMDPILRGVEDAARVVQEPLLGIVPLLSKRMLAHHGWMRRHWVPASILAVALITGSFFLVHERVFQNLAATRMPVQMINPEGGLDANP